MWNWPLPFWPWQAARKLAITEVDLERAEARLEAAEAWVLGIYYRHVLPSETIETQQMKWGWGGCWKGKQHWRFAWILKGSSNKFTVNSSSHSYRSLRFILVVIIFGLSKGSKISVWLVLNGFWQNEVKSVCLCAWLCLHILGCTEVSCFGRWIRTSRRKIWKCWKVCSLLII